MAGSGNNNVPGNLDQRLAGLGVGDSNDARAGGKTGGNGPKRYIPPHLRGKPPTEVVDKSAVLERTSSWNGDMAARDRSRSTERAAGGDVPRAAAGRDERGDTSDVRRSGFAGGRGDPMERTTTWAGRRDDGRGFGGRGARGGPLGLWAGGKHVYGQRNPRTEAELFGTAEDPERMHTGINFEKYDDIPVEASGRDAPAPITNFDEADLEPLLLENIKLAGYTVPTPVQKSSISFGRAGRDMMACAQTGSGKTGGFLFPILNESFRNGPAAAPAGDGRGHYRSRAARPIALILSPTRELASQINDEARKFCYRSWVRPCVVYGGADIGMQLREVERGCDLLVATPGRLVDLIERGRVSLSCIRYLVLDEADRMLDMGFEPQIRRIVEKEDMPGVEGRQTLMFSATFPRDIQMLARDFLKDYIFLSVGRVGSTSENITQKIEYVEDEDKLSVLLDILTSGDPTRLTLVFVETKRMADRLSDDLLYSQLPASAIHGDRTQRERERALEGFRAGRTPVLVATAVAARGLDIPNVSLVVNYDLPNEIDEYVHRVGRTGRAGNTGNAVSFFNRGNRGIARNLIDLLKEANQEIPDWLPVVAREGSGFGGGRGRGRGGYSGGSSRGGGFRDQRSSLGRGDRDFRPSNGAPSAAAHGRSGGGGARGSGSGHGGAPSMPPAFESDSRNSWF
ncbi:ATP-dependent RNA helicase ded1 [Coemansia thaxteri]|uniref:ATP-dependent RNA helicase DED1 n=1 Tax=Coemansia thaxteri TaxID=2663907 RepID=A0A9W8BL49_9FUNG|nr:ATP-dependent RNA helicase ded1 [Coemansia thaxteri]KAJ2009204.1 ATP-dependent RNA helicase ded1 [Coemansia thaxteri]KAJ2472650.1 ATP-dependent RNA helicase ded1 [Coemansia sp. RSA 2322]KAJ2486468.1 ATP-dependent RNA helicase ded1 [Coemansia sp. RSA 2320]